MTRVDWCTVERSANIGNRLDSTGFHRDPGFGGFDMEVGQEASRRRASVRFSPPDIGVGHGLGVWTLTLWL